MNKKSRTKEEDQIILNSLMKINYIEDAAFIISILKNKNDTLLFKWFVGILIAIFGIVVSILKLILCD